MVAGFSFHGVRGAFAWYLLGVDATCGGDPEKCASRRQTIRDVDDPELTNDHLETLRTPHYDAAKTRGRQSQCP